MKAKLHQIKLQQATDRSQGVIYVECTWNSKSFQVEYCFPDNHNLFSPDGDYQLKVLAINTTESAVLSCDQDESFREALGGTFTGLSYRKIRTAVEKLLAVAFP
jgi:hypothetical protein